MEYDALMRDCVAGHFPAGRVRGDDIELGFGELHLRCWVAELQLSAPQLKAASLRFEISGGPLGAPVLATITGYGPTVEEAVVTGACNWTCMFGPVLRAGLAGEPRRVRHFDTRGFRVFIERFDRTGSIGDPAIRPHLAGARARFAPRRWLAREILDAGRLPPLDASRPTVLSVFLGDVPDCRIVEVKVNGEDQPDMADLFAGVAPDRASTMIMLRELAVLVPLAALPARSWLGRLLDRLRR